MRSCCAWGKSKPRTRAMRGECRSSCQSTDCWGTLIKLSFRCSTYFLLYIRAFFFEWTPRDSQKTISPDQIPFTIFCTTRWLRKLFAFATAAISKAFDPIKERVRSSSGKYEVRSAEPGGVIWRSAVSRFGCFVGCCLRFHKSAVFSSVQPSRWPSCTRPRIVWAASTSEGSVGVLLLAGSSCNRYSISSCSDRCARNLQATNSQA